VLIKFDAKFLNQLAADQAWPWRTPGVATLRKDFLLPVDRTPTD
jgi:hypothetical protein